MAAKSQKERDDKAAAKRIEMDEKELRHRCRRGTRDKLEELMAWHGITEQAEAIQLLIWNAHALGPEGSAPALAIPRHEYALPESVARTLYQQGAKEAASMDRFEQLPNS
ncbi:hypothetical protein [Pseudomonas sp. SO81]|uniref:hypothetical protein n=1 Tax=Pseudomonas sp. SO81 TaxID=2983246 RepID=UPI0025A3BBB5|nr:hypothetical protein [Pseudomonas sp. SO81]WJN60901.1 hypothetical protein OH686_19325 [Pseudomonas sp. SO81]